MFKKTKKYLRSGLTGLLVVGVIAAIGFLSFTGMLVLSPVILFAILTFIAVAAIEGEVYAQSIKAALKKLFKRNHLKDAISLRKLNRLAKENKKKPDNEKSAFLTDYQAYLDQYEKLKAEKEKLGWFYVWWFEEAKDLRDQLKAVKQQLKWRRSHFKHFLFEDIKGDPLEQNSIINAFKNSSSATLLLKITQRTRLSYLCFAASMIAGIGMGFVFLSVAPESIIATATFFGIALSAGAFPLVVTVMLYALAIVAAAGYMMLIYHALTDMLQNKTFKQWWKGLKAFFDTPKPGIDLPFVVKRCFMFIGVLLVVGLAIFATVVTAGTWWGAAKVGAAFIPVVSEWLSGAAVAIMGLTGLLFGLHNSITSVKQISHFSWKSIKNQFRDLRKKIENYFETENLGQKLNPFRAIIVMIEIPFKLLAFLGHLVSTGVAGDRFEPVSPLLSAIVGATNDGLVDFHFVFPDNHDHHHHHSDDPHDKKEKLKTKSDSFSKWLAYDDESHAHSHTDIPGKFLFIALSPLYFLSALVDFVCSQFNDEPKKPILTFSQALKKSFFGRDVLLLSKKNPEDTMSTQTKGVNYSDQFVEHTVARALAKNELNKNEKEFFGDVNSVSKIKFFKPETKASAKLNAKLTRIKEFTLGG